MKPCHTNRDYVHILVAEGRPHDALLAVAVDPQPAAPQALRPVVHNVPGLMQQLGTLVQLQPDDAAVGQVGNLEPVARVVGPPVW